MVVCAHLREMTSAVSPFLAVISAERRAVTFQSAPPQKKGSVTSLNLSVSSLRLLVSFVCLKEIP